MNIPLNYFSVGRLTAIIAGSLIFALMMPAAGQPRHGFDLVAGLIVGITLAFLVYQAAERRRRLFSAVYLELNKLRRIYHLSKNLSNQPLRSQKSPKRESNSQR